LCEGRRYDFQDPASLQACISSGARIEAKGRSLTYRPARPRNVITDTCAVVGIPDSVTDEQLLAHFSQFRPTEAKIVHWSRDNGTGLGFAKFASQGDRDRAIQALNESMLGGRAITVKEASRPFKSDDEHRGSW